jgi:hypothetical protein
VWLKCAVEHLLSKLEPYISQYHQNQNKQKREHSGRNVSTKLVCTYMALVVFLTPAWAWRLLWENMEGPELRAWPTVDGASTCRISSCEGDLVFSAQDFFPLQCWGTNLGLTHTCVYHWATSFKKYLLSKVLLCSLSCPWTCDLPWITGVHHHTQL